MANPHSIDTKNAKLLSLDGLKRYHHNLIAALGLIQDTGAYEYSGDRTDFVETMGKKTLNVQEVLTKYYDLLKAGAVEFKTGYAEDATKTVKFDSEDKKDTNLYYINAKVGDDIVNIELDANDFVKDSVLESVMLLNISGTGEGETRTYKVNGTEATYDAAAGTMTAGEKVYYVGSDVTTLEAGTYFYYTWKTDDGEAGITRQYTAVSLKDVYGDLKGSDYITYDPETCTISAQVADVVYDATAEAGNKWSVDSEDTTNLATAENLADVANKLQDQIDHNNIKDGIVSFSTADESTALEADNSEETGTKYDLTLAIASDNDVDSMFALCATNTASTAEDIKNATDPATTAVEATGETAADALDATSNSNTYNTIKING